MPGGNGLVHRDETHTPDEPVLTAEDIEAAYERALRAMESVEEGVHELAAAADADSAVIVEDDAPRDAPSPARPLDGHDDALSASPAPVLHPREVIEAALFVGGPSLTAKRLGEMLGGHDPPERIDEYVRQLNGLYQDEARPYRIDFGEGGYRLVLLAEFEPVRNSVFGMGPKDVKLSQHALEVLAFIAYRQPSTQWDLEQAGRDNAAGLLRQLLRRELIELHRDEAGEVTYSTTARFLKVFGLRSLDDLPFPEDLELK